MRSWSTCRARRGGCHRGRPRWNSWSWPSWMAAAGPARSTRTRPGSGSRDSGTVGNLDQLRAAVFVALLGRDPRTLLPPGTSRAHPERTPTPGAHGPHPEPTTPAWSAPGCSGGLAGLTGSVNLTIPLATWLGTADAPGEVAGLGPLDADTSRDLATRLTDGPETTWCVTLTDPDPDRRAAAHAYARASPDRSPAGRRAWLGALRFHWLEPGGCGHRLQGRALPAQPHPAAPDQDPPADLRPPRLPPPRPGLRRRPHHPLPPGRSHLRMHPRPPSMR